MNYETKRFPLITFILIGINVLVYLVSLIFFFGTNGTSDDWILQNLWLVPAKILLVDVSDLYVRPCWDSPFGR